MNSTLEASLDAKIADLDERIHSYGKVAVAFSGGVDSTALLHACLRVLGAPRVLAVTAESESLARAEKEEAIALGRRLGARLCLVRTMELADPDYRRNEGDRCYFCKRELFSVMERMAREEGIGVIAYGAIADDLLDHRPGARAAAEFRVAAPLQESGLSKEEIRRYSSRHALPTASKASFACLSSRVPRGTQVTAQVLAQIESAEESLRRRGFRQFRVRHFGSLAKIEVGREEIERLLGEEGSAVAKELGAAGYERVALDLCGYRDPAAAALIGLETPFWGDITAMGAYAFRWVCAQSGERLREIAKRMQRGDCPATPALWDLQGGS